MKFEAPSITDFGSIAAHTFSRSEVSTGEGIPPKDWRNFDLDKHGESSEGHGGLS